MNEPVTKELVIHKIKHNLRRLRTAIKWIIFSILSGLLIGMVGIAFYFGMTWVTDTRTAYPWLIFFLPLGGIMIILLYHLLMMKRILEPTWCFPPSIPGMKFHCVWLRLFLSPP